MYKKKIGFGTLLKRYLFLLFSNGGIYTAIALFLFSSVGYFFFLQHFFDIERAQVDLHVFFSFFPIVSIVFIPSLLMGTVNPLSLCEKDIPVSSFFSLFSQWLSFLIVYSLSAFVTVAIPFSLSFFGDVSRSHVVVGYIGIILYASALLSFAVFSVVFFKNSIVSFFSMVILLFAMNFIHLLPLYIDLSNKASRFIRFFSFKWHFDSFGRGIIDTRDVFFFILFTVFFLIMAFYSIEKDKFGSPKSSCKEKQILFKSTLSFAFFIGVLFFNVTAFYTRIDCTESKKFTLDEYTKELLDSLESPLHITYYCSSKLDAVYPQIKNIKDFLFQYGDYTNKVTISIKDPQKKKRELEAANIKGQTIKNSSNSYSTVYSGIVLETAGESQSIPFILSDDILEYSIDAKLQYLLSKKGRILYMISGNSLSFEDEYKYVSPYLEAYGFTAISITIEQLSNPSFINKRYPVLFLGSSEFSSRDTSVIKDFLFSGGRAFFAVSPLKAAIPSSWEMSSLNQNSFIELLDYWGFSFYKGILADRTHFTITMNSKEDNSLLRIEYPFWIRLLENSLSKDSSITKSLLPLQTFWCSPFSIFPSDSLHIKSLIQSSSEAWISYPDEKGVFLTDPFSKDILVENSQTKGSYTIAAAAQGKFLGNTFNSFGKETRCIVYSDQYFCSTMLEYTNAMTNFDFLVNSLLWLSYEDSLLSVKAKNTYSASSLYKIADKDSFLFAAKKTVFFIVLFYTGVLFVFFLVFFIRRQFLKKKYQNILLKGEFYD